MKNLRTGVVLRRVLYWQKVRKYPISILLVWRWGGEGIGIALRSLCCQHCRCCLQFVSDVNT